MMQTTLHTHTPPAFPRLNVELSPLWAQTYTLDTISSTSPVELTPGGCRYESSMFILFHPDYNILIRIICLSKLLNQSLILQKCKPNPKFLLHGIIEQFNKRASKSTKQIDQNTWNQENKAEKHINRTKSPIHLINKAFNFINKGELG